jgi:hypothetical protein
MAVSNFIYSMDDPLLNDTRRALIKASFRTTGFPISFRP